MGHSQKSLSMICMHGNSNLTLGNFGNTARQLGPSCAMSCAEIWDSKMVFYWSGAFSSSRAVVLTTEKSMRALGDTWAKRSNHRKKIDSFPNRWNIQRLIVHETPQSVSAVLGSV